VVLTLGLDDECFGREVLVFTARRKARIASAVLAMAFPSVCPSVCLSVTRRDDPFPLKSWLQVTYPVLIAARLDTFCLVAPQR